VLARCCATGKSVLGLFIDHGAHKVAASAESEGRSVAQVAAPFDVLVLSAIGELIEAFATGCL